MPAAPNPAELHFLRTYKDAVMHFNRLDLNLAYCLRAASGRNLASVLADSYDKKLKQLHALVCNRGRLSAYAGFLELAGLCRPIRNQLVHGQWDFLPRLPNSVRFQVPAPFEVEGYLTLEEFITRVAVFRQAGDIFIALQKKHPLPAA